MSIYRDFVRDLRQAELDQDFTETFGINPRDKRFAEKANAAILRSQYEAWARTYQPIEDELLGAFNNPALRQQAGTEAVALFNRGADAADAATDRRLAGLGLTLTPEQAAVRERSQSLQRGLGEVAAFNQTVRGVDDRNRRLLTGLSGVGRTGGV